MIYIDGLGYIDESTSYKTGSTKPSNDNTFDAVLEQETIIYATPESNGTQENTNHPQSIDSPAELDTYFNKAASKYGLDAALLKAVAKQESNFNPNSVSSAGAIGIMQLMPGTASSLGVTNPYDAEQNIMGGAKYLSRLLQKYNGSISLALAAYNAGPGNVDKYNGIPPFKETQNYVKKVLAYMDSNLSAGNTIYATAANPAGRQQDLSEQGNTVKTIYAVASNDATASAHIYTISAVPSSNS